MSATPMTDEQREHAVWQLVLDYLATASPEQWHVYAARSNYDGNARGLQWLLDNPALDRGTALLIYWYLGAAWYVQFGSEAEMAPYQRDTFHTLQLIEQRHRDGFWARDAIWFDPAHSEGGGPGDYPDLPQHRPTPASMLQATAGRDYVDLDPEGYDEGLPLELAERIFALYD